LGKPWMVECKVPVAVAVAIPSEPRWSPRWACCSKETKLHLVRRIQVIGTFLEARMCRVKRLLRREIGLA
jgi:hypothetical protein